MKLTLERLKEVLSYNPETGNFSWRPGHKLFGYRAGTTLPAGYTQIAVDGKFYRASRLAWFYMTGQWPKFEVDHKDRNPANDRWDNLKEVTSQQNKENTSAHVDSKSQVKGVSWDAKRQKWIAQICESGRNRNLGRYAKQEDAIAAYEKAAQERKERNRAKLVVPI